MFKFQDDDFSIRLVEKELCVLRPKKEFSQYIMQGHHASASNDNRWDLIMKSTQRIDIDGLSNIAQLSKVVAKEEYFKYTRLLVDVNFTKS